MASLTVKELREELGRFATGELHRELIEIRDSLLAEIVDKADASEEDRRLSRSGSSSLYSVAAGKSSVMASNCSKPLRSPLLVKPAEGRSAVKKFTRPETIEEEMDPLSWWDGVVEIHTVNKPQPSAWGATLAKARSSRQQRALWNFRTGEGCSYEQLATDDVCAPYGGGNDSDDDPQARLPQETEQTCSCFVKFVNSRRFDLAMGALVMANAIFVGVETDFMARNWSDEGPPWFAWIEFTFCAAFTLELFARVLAHGVRLFCNETWYWNVFDASVVILQIADLWNKYDDGEADKRSSSFIRMMRFARIARVLRLLHLVKDLRSLIVPIKHTVLSLFWLTLMMIGMTGVLGVVLTQMVTDHKLMVGREKILTEQAELQELFGTLDRTISKLWQAISEGTHWGELSDPLARFCSPVLNVVFMIYMAFVFFAFMNVLTAVVVENALRGAQDEKRAEILRNLKGVFGPRGVNEDIGITKESFHREMSCEQMNAYFQELGLSDEQRRECSIFELVDLDQSGEIDSAELIHSCMQLTGPAKAINLALLAQDMRKEWDLLHDFCARMENRLGIESGPQERPRPFSTVGVTRCSRLTVTRRSTME